MSCKAFIFALFLSTGLVTCKDNNNLFCVYETSNTTLKDYHCKLYLSHFLPYSGKKSEACFDNGLHVIDIRPEEVGVKTSKRVNSGIKTGDRSVNFSIVRRITPGNLSKNKKPRVLVIGDSVTDEYGSDSNKSESWLPNQYWAYAKMFFEKERIDNGDNPEEYNSIFLGTRSVGDFTINYNGVKRTIRARAEGYGGAALQELFEPTLGNQKKLNRFYDNNHNTFSSLLYLERYRTMDDQGERLVSASVNPAGEVVKGSDGKEYKVGSEIKTQSLLSSVDVCTPSIVVVNLCHNTSLDNYKMKIGPLVNIIHKELPETQIVIMTIDETGTLFPQDYPEYDENRIMYKGYLHDKNAKIYNYLKDNVENEKEGVYLLAAQFVMPTAEGYPTILSNNTKVQNPKVIGPEYHPNNKVHEAWGYALYSMIKYLITD